MCAGERPMYLQATHWFDANGKGVGPYCACLRCRQDKERCRLVCEGDSEDFKSGLGLVEIARVGAVKRGPRERSYDKGSALRVRGRRTFVSS